MELFFVLNGSGLVFLKSQHTVDLDSRFKPAQCLLQPALGLPKWLCACQSVSNKAAGVWATGGEM